MQTSIGQSSIFGTGPFPTPAAESTSDSSSSSSSSSTDSATITGNDFLQLLVTELQNQDPTANTDPNEYITQLVQVNSLEQLVQINQDLGGSSSGSTTSASGSTTLPSSAAANAANPSQPASGAAGGNLALPGYSAAATRVAQALAAPSAPPSPADLQNFIRTSSRNAGAGTTFSTAR